MALEDVVQTIAQARADLRAAEDLQITARTTRDDAMTLLNAANRALEAEITGVTTGKSIISDVIDAAKASADTLEAAIKAEIAKAQPIEVEEVGEVVVP